MRKNLKTASILAVCAGSLLAGSASALTLPDPTDPTYKNVSVFALGDFYSFLLPVLAYQYDPSKTGPGNPFYVESTPGAIKDGIVIATGANGQGVETNPDGFDDAYDTTTNGTAFSTTNGFPDYMGDPGTKGVGDPTQEGYTYNNVNYSTWDADVAALRTFLSGQKALFFFNHNETQGDENILAWGQIILTSDDPGKYPDIYLDLTYNNDLGQTPLPGITPEVYQNTEGFGFVDDSITQLDWVTSPGEYNYVGGPANGFNLNLGANQAAYAVYSPDLQAVLDNPNSPYTHLHLLLLLNDIDNGYEQVFLLGGQVAAIPLPSASIMGMGLLGLLGGYRLMRRRTN